MKANRQSVGEKNKIKENEKILKNMKKKSIEILILKERKDIREQQKNHFQEFIKAKREANTAKNENLVSCFSVFVDYWIILISLLEVF